MRHEINQLTTELPFTPITFMEIGSRDGHDTKEVADYWNLDPKDCYIIEAYPALCDRIKAQYPEFNTFGFAASDEIGTIEFNAVPLTDHDNNIGISSILECTAYNVPSNKITVQTNTITNFLDYCLKIRQFKKLLSKVPCKRDLFSASLTVTSLVRPYKFINTSLSRTSSAFNSFLCSSFFSRQRIQDFSSVFSVRSFPRFEKFHDSSLAFQSCSDNATHLSTNATISENTGVFSSIMIGNFEICPL